MTSKRKTIFLVDDNITNLTIGKKALSGSYNVFTLNSGETMLEMLENIVPDLILLDIDMPGMNGYEVIKRLKSDEKNADIPVIFLTALDNEEMELEGLSLGAVDYIAKPFSPLRLLKRIEIHLLIEAQKQELVEQKQELIRFNVNLSQLVKERTKTIEELKNAILSIMAELVENRDKITGGHIARTQNYIKVLIEAMKEHEVYKDEMIKLDKELILLSCQLHDVGKIAIKDSILNKPGKLTPEEFQEIKTHAAFGEKAMLKLKEKTMDNAFVEYARIFAVSHHEKWDGSGYPNKLKGEDIPLLGRIMAIADVYDALVADRPYKKALSHERAVQIILEGKGNHFDPILIGLFEKIHPEFEKIAAKIAR